MPILRELPASSGSLAVALNVLGRTTSIGGVKIYVDGNALLRAVLDADADADGAVTLAELGAVDVAGLGYAVGQYSEVTTLADFVAFLTQTLGHVDGEGHCQVDI